MSRLFSIRRDLMTILGLVMLGVAMLLVGSLTSTAVREAQLMSDGRAEAKRWATNMASAIQSEANDIRNSFIARKFFLDHRFSASRVFAFDIFDKNGNLFHSAGPSNWRPRNSATQLLQSPVTRYNSGRKQFTSQVHLDEKAASAKNYASVVIPYYSAKDYLGSIVAFVDQNEQAYYLATSFRITAALTSLMLLIAFSISLLFVIFRTRDRAKAEQRVHYLSRHDELTGLPNRRSFDDMLSRELETCKKTGSHLAVIVIDIDRFKEINDALGHSAGDSVLRYVTEILKSNIRDGDAAARIGSDQFALILTSIARAEQAAVFTATLTEALSAPLWVNGEQITCTVSIGGSVAPDDTGDPAILMRHANLALGQAKADGGNACEFFEDGMAAAFIKRRDMETDLRRAIETDQFELHYQPQVILNTQTICGFEALIRWNRPNDGTISPAFFIPLAEETELIVPIGEWVLRRACMDAAAWDKPLKVAVNLSAIQFKRIDMVKLVRSVLKETGLDPARLELEITESLLINTTGKVVADLNGLRALGVSIAMDDFGTGYSSLSYISSFPFNRIKIDKSFVRMMTRDKAILGVVKCIIAMGRSLGVSITAEGVETSEQNQIVKSLGCHQVQGFLYGGPVSASECAKRISGPLKIRPTKQTGAKQTSANQASAKQASAKQATHAACA